MSGKWGHGWRVRIAGPLVAALVTSSLVALAPAASAAQSFSEVPLDGWDSNGTVYAVKVIGDTLYLGGTFSALRNPTSSESVARANLAAIDVTSGQLLPFSADTNGPVRAIEANGTHVWVGGTFSAIGGEARPGLASLDAVSGAVLADFDVSSNGGTYGLVLGGDRLYASGHFTIIEGIALERVASLDPTSGLPDPAFQANADGEVRAIAFAGATDRLFVAGSFTTIGSQPWSYLAELDPATGAGVGPGFAHSDAQVLDLDTTPDGSRVFAAAAGFDNSATAWSTFDGSVLWFHRAMGDTQAVSYHDGTVYFGFHEGFDDDLTVRMLAADAVSGELQDFRPTINSFFGVWAIDAAAGAVGIGGTFTEVSGVATRRVAVFPGASTPPDVVAPSMPTGLVNPVPSGEAVALEWDATDDDRGVSYYIVWRDGQVLGPTLETSFIDTDVEPDTSYSYRVQASDLAGNLSELSLPLDVTIWTMLIRAGDPWRYSDVPQPSGDWQQPGFDDSNWSLGNAELGFGDGDEATVLTSGMTTYYFRSQVALPADKSVVAATIGILRDDGAVLYVNGVEVYRSNMPEGAVASDTRAAIPTTGSDESRWFDAALAVEAFQSGVNEIAVEVHQYSTGSSDVSFDFHLEVETAGIVLDVSPPGRPLVLVAEARSATRVRLSWGAASDDVGVVGYRVFQDNVEVRYTSSLALLMRDLLPETLYRFKVFAVDEAGNVSPRSRIVKATTFADTARPSRPKHTTVSVGVESVVVDWDPATDNVGVSHYLVKSGGVVLGTTTDTSWVIGGLEPGTDYAVALWAFDTSGNRSRRVLRQFTTLSE